jgi:hypothetical protein
LSRRPIAFCNRFELYFSPFPVRCHPEVLHRENRMGMDHFGSREFHDFPDFGFHLLSIAVNLTFSAGRLLFPEGAFEGSLAGIPIQLLTAFAAFFTAMMMAPAVHIDHDADRLDFPFSSLQRCLRVAIPYVRHGNVLPISAQSATMFPVS